MEKKRELSSYSFKELDNIEIQAKLIEESDDKEFMYSLFERMNQARRDSLNPNKGE